MDCKVRVKARQNSGKGADCKEKVKEEGSAGKDENCKIYVKRQRSFGKEDFYENGVKRRENSGKAELCEDGVKRRRNSGKAKLGKAAAKCGARAKNHKGRTTCNASECEQLRQVPEGKKRTTRERMRAGSARRENDNHRRK